MTADDTLWDLEERFWTQGPDSARHAMVKGAVFVLSYPVGILQGDALWKAKDVAQRWRSVEISEHYLSRQKDIAVLAYRVSAERGGAYLWGALRLDLPERRGRMVAVSAPADAGGNCLKRVNLERLPVSPTQTWFGADARRCSNSVERNRKLRRRKKSSRLCSRCSGS
jgi:hypothetical protein